MPSKPETKPTITILYDAAEEAERTKALAAGAKFPILVSAQIEEILTRRGYKARRLAAEPPIKKLVRQIEDDDSDLVFNVCESLGGAGEEERRIASILELLDKRFTGSGSLALTLAGDKSLSKKMFEFHGVKSPDFAIIAPGHVEGTARLTSFPFIVKPIATDASIGINAKSVVHNVEDLMNRVFSIQEEFHTPALVEEYIDGREIYIGLLGNPPVMLTPIEWDLSKLPPDMPRIAGTEAKWEEEKNPEFKAAKEFVPQDVLDNEEIMERIRTTAFDAFKALLIRDYARIDMRLKADGIPYVIEVNPNPWLDKAAEFAMAARRSKPELSYGDMIERIVELAMARPFRDRNGSSR
jgi:D-alanine-D-alanine ligase